MLQTRCAIGVLAILSASAAGQGLRDVEVVFVSAGERLRVQVNSVGDVVMQEDDSEVLKLRLDGLYRDLDFGEVVYSGTRVVLGSVSPLETGWPAINDHGTVMALPIRPVSSGMDRGGGMLFAYRGVSLRRWRIGDYSLLPGSPDLESVAMIAATSGTGTATWGRIAGNRMIDGEEYYGFISVAKNGKGVSLHNLGFEVPGGVVRPGRVIALNGADELLMGGPFVGEGAAYPYPGSLSVLSGEGAQLVARDGDEVVGEEGLYVRELPDGNEPLFAPDYALSETGGVIYRAGVWDGAWLNYRENDGALLEWQDGETRVLALEGRVISGPWAGTFTHQLGVLYEPFVGRFDRNGRAFVRANVNRNAIPGAPTEPGVESHEGSRYSRFGAIWEGAVTDERMIIAGSRDVPGVPGSFLYDPMEFRFAEDLGRVVFDGSYYIEEEREWGLWAADDDADTDDEPRLLIRTGDSIEVEPGDVRVVAGWVYEEEGSSLIGVTRQGQVIARVRFEDGSWAVVQVELRAGIADMNGDGVYDLGDIGAFVRAFLNDLSIADMNGDGVLDLGDLDAFIEAFLDAVG